MNWLKATNGRLIPRSGDGRFRRFTGQDVGIGGVCPKCDHLLLRHYDGDESQRPLDPAKWRYRCFTCEPREAAND